jgi:hypothetical protein
MKKLIALIALIIYSQPSHAMNVEQYAQDLYELQKFVFDNIRNSSFASDWPSRLSAFQAKYQEEAADQIVSPMLNMTYAAKLNAQDPLVSRIFSNVASSFSKEGQWNNAFDAVVNLAKVIRTKNASAQKYDATVKNYFAMYAQKLLDAAKKIALDEYALPYYAEKKGVTSMDEIGSGRVAALRDLDWNDNAIKRNEEAQQLAQKEAEEQEMDEANRRLAEIQKEKGKLQVKRAAHEQEEQDAERKLAEKKREKKKLAQEEESSSSADNDEEIIAKALKLVQTLPEKLAKYRLNQDTDAEKKALRKLDKIQAQYIDVYNRNKNNDNESIEEITDLLAEGVPAPITREMRLALDAMEQGKLKDALEQVNALIADGNKRLAQAKKESEKDALRKQLEPLENEKKILEALIKNPDSDAIFAHQKELLKELDDLKAAFKKAKKDKDEQRKEEIEKEIDRLHLRAPHLLSAAEMGRDAQTKRFLPKNIRAYIEAKRDEILEEKRQESKK